MISTERLLLRAWREADRDDFAAMNADPAVMEFFPAPLDRPTSDRLFDRINRHFVDHGYGLLVVEERSSGAFLGFTGLAIPVFEAAFTPCVEIGWRYHRAAWGRGYATEAALACLRFGFEELKLSEICSFTSVLNLRSIAVMKRIGMRPDGQFDHPGLPAGHRLVPHVLYRIANKFININF